MPQISLSWDLFIVVFFAIVMSYSFIVGKQKSMNIIIAAYIAVIAVQGMTTILTRILHGSGMTLESMGIPVDVTMIALAKMFLFALCIIIFLLRSGIDVSYEKDTGSILNIVYTGLFGFSTAGLIVSTILTYASGSSILDASLVTLPLANSSTLMQLMMLNQSVWYALPALLIIALGFLHKD